MAETRFGPYVVHDLLGTGGMATVHLAETQSAGGFRKRVALKRMLPHLTEEPEIVDAFAREARLASFLHHQHIAQTFDLGVIEGTYYIAMELVSGPTLRQIVRLDPGALIILQSDHGSAFRGQFKKSPSDWSEADLHERFGALNAMRLPEPCRTLAAPDLTLVDTFPLVFACLTGGDFKRHSPPRFFVTPYDDSQDFGHLVEYKADQFH